MIIRSLFRKGESNSIKILSLSIGITMGLILIAKVLFEYSYDNFYPDADRIYAVQSVGTRNGEAFQHERVSGGVAIGMKDEIAEIETATRFTGLLEEELVFYTADRKKHKGNLILADSCFFDVLPRKIIAGNAKEVLSRPMHVMISEKLANMIGQEKDIIGQRINLDIAPDKTLIIGGVFETLPENTHFHYDLILSMPSIGQFIWDGTENWNGNDRYNTYVKVYPGVDPATLETSIIEMIGRHSDLEGLKRAGYDNLTYTLEPLLSLHSGLPATKRMALLLSVLSFTLIFTTVMNYILLVLSSLVNRVKNVAVRKTYGANIRNISGLIFSETFVHFILSLLLSILLIFLFKPIIHQVIGVSIKGLFTLQTLLYLSLICLLIFILAGVLPAYFYAKIPVATVFRNYKETKKSWKLSSLFFQIAATTFLIVFMVIIGKQYKLMIHDNPGYTYENLLYCDVNEVSESDRNTLLNELRRIPAIKDIANCTLLPIRDTRFPGNNVSLNNEKDLFNIADQYFVDENFFSLMDIPIIEGTDFSNNPIEGQIVVSKKFADTLLSFTGWTDGVVGKNIFISEHDMCTIVGVHNDIRLGTIAKEELRPSAYFYAKNKAPIILMKMDQLNAENILQVTSLFEKTFPMKDINVKAYKLSMIDVYRDARLFRDAVIIGGIITLLITLIGLIGYVKEETLRRRSEIAIRKINGGTLKDILKLFATNILKITIPALLIGCIIALIATEKWLEGFSDKASLSSYLLILCGLVVTVIVMGTVAFNSYQAANENPVDSLKNE